MYNQIIPLQDCTYRDKSLTLFVKTLGGTCVFHFVSHELYQMHEFYPDKDVKGTIGLFSPLKLMQVSKWSHACFGKHVLDCVCVCVYEGLCGCTSFEKGTNLVFEEGG